MHATIQQDYSDVCARMGGGCSSTPFTWNSYSSGNDGCIELVRCQVCYYSNVSAVLHYDLHLELERGWWVELRVYRCDGRCLLY